MINQAFDFFETVTNGLEGLDELTVHRITSIRTAVDRMTVHDTLVDESLSAPVQVVEAPKPEPVTSSETSDNNVVQLDAARRQVIEAYPESLAA